MEKGMEKLVKQNSVVQICDTSREGWGGCLVQVDEVKTWGIQGWVQIPMGGRAFIRLKWDQIDYIGQATMVTPEEQTETKNKS